MPNPESTTHGVVFDLPAAERELRAQPAYLRDGYAARTLVREPDLRLVLMVMAAGRQIPAHQADDTVSIHALSGSLRVTAGGNVFDLTPGQIVALEGGLRHEVDAPSDAAFLLTLAWGRETRTPTT